MWLTVDEKDSGTLGFDDVTVLMKKLNIKLSRSEVKSTFKVRWNSNMKNANMTTLDTISFDNFERYYRNLAFRPEISELFHKIAISNPSGITFEEFRQFVRVTQNVAWSEARIEEVFAKYSPDKELHLMDMNHFTAFLLSANNSIFRKENSIVYQNMDLPLFNYYINTSHNTYLLGDQIAGQSSIEGYIRALQQGCRCIECKMQTNLKWIVGMV
jgi:Ca2+-binding EF-hand superfamily protein